MSGADRVANALDEGTSMTTPEQKGFPLKRWLAAPLMVGALAGGYGLAAAQTDTPSTTDSTNTTVGPGRGGPGGGETALTGETAEKVKAAALKAVPDGTVDRVETDSDGSPYEAHMTKAAGSHVTVKVNEAFEVTSIEADNHGPRPSNDGQSPA